MKPAVIFIAVLALCSCMSDHKIAMADVNPYGWNCEQTLSAPYLNEDTTSIYALSLVARWWHNHTMAQDIVLQVGTLTPDSLFFSESVTIRIGTDGERSGWGFRETEVPFRENALLTRPGTYNFTFTPDQPTPYIIGLTAVGIVLTPR